MSAKGTEQGSERGLVGLVEAIRAVRKSLKRPSRYVTREQARKRLGVSRRKLRQMLLLGQVVTIRGRIFL